MVRSGRHHGRRANRPVAAVYRGEVACEGCAESVAELLRRSPLKYNVHYLGPNEDHDIGPEMLSHLDLFAWPGGGDDADGDFAKVGHYTDAIQAYVRGGGRYAGICMGAFLAGGEGESQQFFGLLPKGSYVSSERFEPGAEVKDAHDTVIRTDWTFHSGSKAGTTEKERWQYFQDGAQISLTWPPGEANQKRSTNAAPQTLVLGRYSATGNASAVVVPYGKGAVGLIGTHPEADQSWYDDYDIVNPQNVTFDIGHDFLQTLHEYPSVAAMNAVELHLELVSSSFSIPFGSSTLALTSLLSAALCSLLLFGRRL